MLLPRKFIETTAEPCCIVFFSCSVYGPFYLCILLFVVFYTWLASLEHYGMLILTLIVDEFNTDQQFKDNEISGLSDVGLREDSGRDSDSEVDGPVPTCLVLPRIETPATPLA